MDFNKQDFYGYFDGAEGDDMKYVWLGDKESHKLYIVPTDEETAVSINEEYKELFKETTDKNLKIFGYSLLVGFGFGIAHTIMSESGGYEKVGEWTKKKINNIKSKFKKKAE
jgi:hypothetical protein